jgi:hypothetical protein
MQTYSPIAVFTGRAAGITEPRRIGCEHGGPTAGHCATEPGLRGHSVDAATYPWRVVGRGNGAWTVEGADGRVTATYAPVSIDDDEACALAHQSARRLKVLHPDGRIDATPGQGIANISGALESIPGRLAGHTLIIRHEVDGTVDRLRVLEDVHQRHVARRWHGSPVVVCRNLKTGLIVEIPTPYLAHNQHIAVSLELADE